MAGGVYDGRSGTVFCAACHQAAYEWSGVRIYDPDTPDHLMLVHLQTVDDHKQLLVLDRDARAESFAA
jgi:hypothetical protein